MTATDVERGYGLAAGLDDPLADATTIERGYGLTNAAEVGGPMPAVPDLELARAYRRWLRWYPPSFRREYEDEMLGVLLASAHQGQRRPDLRECLALLCGALWLRLRPCTPGSDRAILTAVKFMYLGAVVELATTLTIVATIGDIRANVLARNPALTADQWHAVVTGQLEPLAMTAALAVGFWLWMAWSVGHGQRRARIVFALFFGLNTWSLLHGLAGGSAVYARPDLAVASILWLIELAAVALLFRLRMTAGAGRIISGS